MRKNELERVNSILRWYVMNARDLPWRHTRDPYKILVSEVMLQQTQVDRVLAKYHSFLKRFPTMQKLARAKTGSVIKEWAGLGYNRRALFLQRTAQTVIAEYGGLFPRTLQELKKLPGVGEYTARAILSFAFGEPVAMLDTNHRKVYTHVFFGGRKLSDADLLKNADAIVSGIPKDKVYDWNQALMDYGAELQVKSPKSKVQSQKSVPFKETDRFYRGRIVDLLRQRKIAETTLLREKFSDLPQARFEKILDGLHSDGLLVIENARVRLP